MAEGCLYCSSGDVGKYFIPIRGTDSRKQQPKNARHKKWYFFSVCILFEKLKRKDTNLQELRSSQMIRYGVSYERVGGSWWQWQHTFPLITSASFPPVRACTWARGPQPSRCTAVRVSEPCKCMEIASHLHSTLGYYSVLLGLHLWSIPMNWTTFSLSIDVF